MRVIPLSPGLNEQNKNRISIEIDSIKQFVPRVVNLTEPVPPITPVPQYYSYNFFGNVNIIPIKPTGNYAYIFYGDTSI